MLSTRRQVAAENGQVGRSTQADCTVPAKDFLNSDFVLTMPPQKLTLAAPEDSVSPMVASGDWLVRIRRAVNRTSLYVGNRTSSQVDFRRRCWVDRSSALAITGGCPHSGVAAVSSIHKLFWQRGPLLLFVRAELLYPPPPFVLFPPAISQQSSSEPLGRQVSP